MSNNLASSEDEIGIFPIPGEGLRLARYRPIGERGTFPTPLRRLLHEKVIVQNRASIERFKVKLYRIIRWIQVIDDHFGPALTFWMDAVTLPSETDIAERSWVDA